MTEPAYKGYLLRMIGRKTREASRNKILEEEKKKCAMHSENHTEDSSVDQEDEAVMIIRLMQKLLSPAITKSAYLSFWGRAVRAGNSRQNECQDQDRQSAGLAKLRLHANCG